MADLSNSPVMQSPLHLFGLPPRAVPMDSRAGVWANEMPLAGFISVRGEIGNPAFLDATAKALGLSLPTEPCTIVSTGSTSALWMSPDEWMIIVPRERVPVLTKALTDGLSGIRSQVVDNSGGYTQVVILGRNARDVLSHCTVYDIDHLGENRIVGTTFGKSSVYLRKHGEGYCLLLRRSFADYIWRYLDRGALPYGFGIAKLPPNDGVGT